MKGQALITALIPAAGAGNRLGMDLPKLLVPITNQLNAWDIIHQKFLPLVHHTHVVLSPKGSELFNQKYGTINAVSTSIQQTPRGMGDAIFGSYAYWKSFDHVIIIWGDQVNVSIDTLKALKNLQQCSDQKSLTIAINKVSNPYVQCDFNEDRSVLVNFRQSREGDICDQVGYADVGLFGLSTTFLLEAWELYLKNPTLGRKTGEINFLPFLVFLSKELKWKLNLVEVHDPQESRGINTPEDLEFFKNKFK